MLPDHIAELLTAYVDGELDTSKRRAVTDLLKKSPEARKFLQKLEEDSTFLRKLPMQKMKLDLSDSVMGEVKSRGLKAPSTPPPAPIAKPAPVVAPPTRGSGIPAWLAVVGIVVGLVAVGVASFFFFAAMR